MEIVERAVFRVTRDADFEVSDDADDLLEAVESELRRRRFGDVVRLEVSARRRGDARAAAHGLGVDDEQVYEIQGRSTSPTSSSSPTSTGPSSRTSRGPATPAAARPRRRAPRDLFDEIRRGDLLVHQPYDSFRTSFEAFVRAAADDPDVIAMKTAVYRTSGDSPLVPALIECAEDGKQSVCLVELKARFDEHRNIEWSRALEQAGVHVVYGFPDLKIHAKMTLSSAARATGCAATSTSAPATTTRATARLYEDFGLFTADEEIAADVADLFNYLTGFGGRSASARSWSLRSPAQRLIEEIRAVAERPRAGKQARIRLKVNALTDEAIIEELYAASQAGRPDRDRRALDLHAAAPASPG